MPRGSAPGERRGGRKKGTSNKATGKIKAAIAESGLTPLEYMLSVLRNDAAAHEDRMEAAKFAAPYMHPRLSSVEHGGKDGGAIIVKIIRYAGDYAAEQLAPASLSNGSVGLPGERRH